MDVPAHFHCSDPALARELIEQHPFATLASSTADAPMITHLPLLAQAPSVVNFHGPHDYVSPA